jgi:hypothetical protein
MCPLRVKANDVRSGFRGSGQADATEIRLRA